MCDTRQCDGEKWNVLTGSKAIWTGGAVELITKWIYHIYLSEIKFFSFIHERENFSKAF